jgi:hypothetical protein
VVTGHNFKSILPKDHPCHVCFKLADWFQKRRLLNNFPIGSYVKTMSADGGHFEPRSGSLNTILEVDHLRTIDDMFAILAYWFQRRRFLNIFPIGSYVKTMSADSGHLGWRFGSLDIISDRQTIHKFSTGPPNDHSCILKSQFNWLSGF